MPRPATPSTDGYQLDPSLDFMRLLWSIEHGLQRKSKEMQRTIGITGPQRLVLRLVGEFPGLSPKELAGILHLHPSTITGILQRLVMKRLLHRTTDRSDRRRVRLTSNQKARTVTRDSRRTVEAAIDQVLSRMSASDIRRSRAVLWEIAAALGDIRR